MLSATQQGPDSIGTASTSPERVLGRTNTLMAGVLLCQVRR